MEKRWANKYEMLKELSKYIHKADLDKIQSTWKIEQIERLLIAYTSKQFKRRTTDHGGEIDLN